MKFFALFATLAAVTTVNAAECTQAQLEQYATKPEVTTVQTACAAMMSGAGASAAANPVEAAKKMCGDKTCLNALQAALKALPDCSSNGVSGKEAFETLSKTIQDACKSAPTASSAASTAVGLSAATTVAVAVFAQL